MNKSRKTACFSLMWCLWVCKERWVWDVQLKHREWLRYGWLVWLCHLRPESKSMFLLLLNSFMCAYCANFPWLPPLHIEDKATGWWEQERSTSLSDIPLTGCNHVIILFYLALHFIGLLSLLCGSRELFVDAILWWQHIFMTIIKLMFLIFLVTFFCTWQRRIWMNLHTAGN